MEQFTESGGYSVQDYAFDRTQETWLQDGIPIEVSIWIPSAPGNLPIVVYLPGMGEDTGHGELWRKAWAKAGYAVVSVQPKEYGEGLLTDQQGKPRDLKSIGRTVFSRHALADRASQLQWTLRTLAARAQSRERYARIDFGRMALVGYDLGAQTAMLLAGEKVDVALPHPLPAFKAAIVISPHVDPTWEKVAQRYADIRIPCLLISGNQDWDPARISTPESRRSIWPDLPAGDKYLLWFEGANHRLLSGTMPHSAYWSEVLGPIVHERGKKAYGAAPGDYDGATGATSRSGGRWLNAVSKGQRRQGASLGYDALGGATSRGGGGGGSSSAGGSGHSSGGKGSGDREGKWEHEKLQEDLELQTRAARQMAIIVSVTTAFLDATVKDTEEARRWLLEDCAPWLTGYAQWLHK